MIITETTRLLIRTFDAQDVKAMCRVLCDPEVMLFSMGVKNPTDVRGWIEHRIENRTKLGIGLWGVVLKDTNSVIGYCGLTQFPDIDGQPEVEIGFRLARSFWSHGYGTESATAVLNYAFEALSLSRLIALVDPRNFASIRVAEKIGMIYEKDVTLNGYNHADRLFAVHCRNGNG